MEKRLTFEQIGSIGNEIGCARKADNQENRNHALRRAIDIIDSILQRESWAGCIREMSILRNVIQDIIDNTGLYDCSLESLEDYCLPFALLARKNI